MLRAFQIRRVYKQLDIPHPRSPKPGDGFGMTAKEQDAALKAAALRLSRSGLLSIAQPDA
jgi:hypothetical protein